MGRNIQLPLSQFGTPVMGRSSFLAPCGIVWGSCHRIAVQLLLCSLKEVNPQLIPFLQISISKLVFWGTQTSTDKQFSNHKTQAIPSVPGHCRLSFISLNFFIKWPFLTLLLDFKVCFTCIPVVPSPFIALTRGPEILWIPSCRKSVHWARHHLHVDLHFSMGSLTGHASCHFSAALSWPVLPLPSGCH